MTLLAMLGKMKMVRIVHSMYFISSKVTYFCLATNVEFLKLVLVRQNTYNYDSPK